LLVDQVLLKTYPLADDSGRHMQVKAAACDSGGQEGVTANAYAFYRWLRDECEVPDLWRRFQLVKGAPKPNAPRVQISYPDAERKDRRAASRGEVPVLLINSNQVKDMAYAMLNRKDPYGGRVSFPTWLPDTFYTELTAEVRTSKGWENPKRLRNESWDLLCYSIALGLSSKIKIEQIDWMDPPSWAREWDENDLVFSPEIEERRFEVRKSSSRSLKDLADKLA
jgi:phage terminase large subunit GpA-like protein